MNLSPSLKDALQQQLNIERQNAAFYNAERWFLESMSWGGFAHWMKRSARDEQKHSDMISKHLVDRGEVPEYEDLHAPMIREVDPQASFVDALHAEEANTERLLKIHQSALDGRDYQLVVFLQPMIDEQTRSVREISDIVTLTMGADHQGLLLLDKHLGKG
jgi:ferritin